MEGWKKIQISRTAKSSLQCTKHDVIRGKKAAATSRKAQMQKCTSGNRLTV